MEKKPIKLDARNKKLLSILDWDARTTNTEISHQLGISKKAVEFRIKKLEEQKIILGYYPFLDFIKLGYKYCRAFIRLQHITDSVRKKMEKFIKSSPSFNWVIWLRGEYGMGLGVWAKNLQEFKEAIYELRKNFDRYIKDIRTSSVIFLDICPYRVITGKQDYRKATINEDSEIVKTSLLDKKILYELTKNARASASKIARAIGSNYKSVSSRIKGMEKNGIILRNRAIINHQALGYTYYKLLFFFNCTDPKKRREIQEYIASSVNVTYVEDAMELADFEAEAVFESNKIFFEFIDSIYSKFENCIRDCKFMIFTDTIKNIFLPKDIIREVEKNL